MESVWELWHDQAIKPIVFDCHEGFIFRNYSIRKWIFPVLQKRYRTHFKLSSSLTFTKFTLNPFIEYLPLANFLEMIRHCWNANTHSWDFSLWQFDVDFVQQIFLYVDRKLQKDVFYPFDHQDSYHQNGTSESRDALSDLKSIPQPMLSLYKQLFGRNYDQAWTHAKNLDASLLFSCSWLGASELQNQILKEVIEIWKRKHFNHLEYDFFPTTTVKIISKNSIKTIYTKMIVVSEQPKC